MLNEEESIMDTVRMCWNITETCHYGYKPCLHQHTHQTKIPPQTRIRSHVISHDTPLLCFQISGPPVILIRGHIATITITDVIPCVIPSWWTFYYKSLFTTYSQPCTFHTAKNWKNDRFTYLYTSFYWISLQATDRYKHKSMAGFTHVYLHFIRN